MTKLTTREIERLIVIIAENCGWLPHGDQQTLRDAKQALREARAAVEESR